MRRFAVSASFVLMVVCGCAAPAATPAAPTLPPTDPPTTVTPSSAAPTGEPSIEAPTSAPTADSTPTLAPTPTPMATATSAPEPFVLTSPAFADGQPIPTRFTCDGADDQLPLEWKGVPEGTAELALIQHDPDAGGFVHWVVVGIPADVAELGEQLPDGARHGTNGFGAARYDGPCPASGNHTYVTTLFALSDPLGLGEAPSAREVRQGAQDITLAQAQLRGTYRRP